MGRGATIEAARLAKARLVEMLAGVTGGTGVGITRIDDGYGVTVNLTAPLGSRSVVPDSVEGAPVRVEVVGRIRPRAR